MPERVQPPVCQSCGTLPRPCPTCDDYACKCPVPWLALKTKGTIVPRAHYDKSGLPYRARFIDGFEHSSYVQESDDLKWLIEGAA